MRPTRQREAKDRTNAVKVVTDEKKTSRKRKVVTDEKNTSRKRKRGKLDGCVRSFHNASGGEPSESSQQPAPAAAKPEKSRTWSCNRCTLNNGSRRKKCEVCSWPKGQPFVESDVGHDADGAVGPPSCSDVPAAVQTADGTSLGGNNADFAGPAVASHAIHQDPTRMSEVRESHQRQSQQVGPPQSQIDSAYGVGEDAMKPDGTQQADAGTHQQNQADTPPTIDDAVSGADVARNDSLPVVKEPNDTTDGLDGPMSNELCLPTDRPAPSAPLQGAIPLQGLTQEGTNFDYMSQVGTHGSISSLAAL